MCGCLCCSSGPGACHSGTEASLTEKDSGARAPECGTWHQQVKRPMFLLCCLPPQVTLWSWRKMALSIVPGEQSAFEEGSLRRTNHLPLMCPRAFPGCSFQAICSWLAGLPPDQEQRSCPVGSIPVEPADFSDSSRRGYDVGRGLCCSSGGGSHCAGAEVSLTWKDNLTRVQGIGVCWKQVRQPLLSPAGASVFLLKGGERNGASPLLCVH